MATEDRVVIHVEIDVDSLGDLAKVTAAMKAIEAQENRINRQTNVMERGLSKLERTTKGFSKTLDAVKNGFGALFRITSKINFIGMAADIGLVSLALLSVKVALVAGRFAVKAYQVALQGLGVAAAAAAGAIGTVAAALSEFQQVNLYPFLGSFRASASAVRGVMGDSLLSFFGQEGLTGAINALAKSGQIAASTFPSILRGLGNFAQDGKQLAQLAEIFSTITKEGKVTSTTLGSLSSINPVFASALAEISSGKVLQGDAAMKIAEQSAEAGAISAEEFTKVFSGELESTNLWEGQLERLNNTLIGQIKGLVVRLGSFFVDLGKPFLEPFRQAIADIERITENAIIRLRSVVTQFGLQSFLPGLVGTFETLADFIVRMANEGMPKLIGIMERVGGFFDSMENFFRNVGAILGPLERGAEAMMTVFGPFLRGLFGARGIGGLIMDAADGFADNADAMARMGQALGDLAFSFMGIFRDLQGAFFSGSDEITDFFTVLSVDVMPVIREMLALWRTMMREALPTINNLLREASRILLPILSAINGIISSFGPLGTAAAFAGIAAMRGGSMAGAAGMGLGGAVGGLPGAIAGGLGASALSRSLAGRGGLGGILAGGGRHAAPTSLASFLGGPTLALGAGVGVGSFAGASQLNKHFGAGGGITTNVGAMGAGGVLAGAGAGALIGSVVPVIGTAVGAVVGAIVGGIGAALGAASGNAVREKANQWITEQIDAVQGEIMRMLEKGTNRAALDEGKKAIKELLDPANVKSMAEQLKLTEKEIRSILEDTTEELENELTTRETNLTKSLDYITDAFDMTQEQVEQLADIMAVDLTDSFNTLMQDLIDLELVVQDIGAAAQALGEQSSLDALRGPGSVLGTAIGKSQAAGIKEEADALLDVIKSTEASGNFGAIPEQIGDLLDMVTSIGQLEHGERGVELLFRYKDALEQLSDPDSQAFVGGETGALASQIISRDIDPVVRSVIDGSHPLYQPLKDSLGAMFAQTQDPSFLWENYFADVITPEVERRGGFQNIQRVLEDMSPEVQAMTLAITNSATQFSADVLSSANYFSTTMVAAASAAGMALRRDAIVAAGYAPTGRGHGAGPPPAGSSGGSSRGGNRFTPHRGGDTATSRLGRVLGFHSALSSRLGGGFSITSGIRNWGLGSMSSDHLAGGAIDLVGNNLGQYANAVNGMGGFAEFHGSAGSRHLHAVPPVGDTTTPANLGSRGGGNMINAQFTISGADDPEAVAEAVVRKMNKMMRDEEERR